MQMGPSLLSADQKYPEPLQQQQQQHPYPGYASLPPNANLSLVTGVPMESPIAAAGNNPYYASLLMLRPPSGSPHTDPSNREAKLFIANLSNVYQNLS